MDWIDGMRNAISYIEKNITKDISADDIASRAYVSSFYFQKAFAMLCGYTVGEYIRFRRLALAGSELATTDARIIDIALKYGYDSPDSFTKAFTRFHGVSPTAVRRDGALIKTFAPLKLKFTLEGGYIMDYKISEKPSFKVIGVSKRFYCDSAGAEIPVFWTNHFNSGKGKIICGMYGICMDADSTEFEYLIADDYNGKEVPEGCKVLEIPAFTWAIFPCKGPMPGSIQEVTRKIFSEWLPNNGEYEMVGNLNIELYTDIRNYPKGNQDENYYSEVWLPIKKK